VTKGLKVGLGMGGILCALWAAERGAPVPESALNLREPTPTSAPAPETPPVLALAPAPAPTPAPETDEEREARRIDTLVALDRIGEAHSAAMAFIQRHPSGPYSAHVMNLMGVHPRPPGALPEGLEESR